MVQVFINGLGDQVSIPNRIIAKTQKTVLDASLLNIQHYKVQVKSNCSNPEKGVVPYPTLQCSSYWIGSLWVTRDYGRSSYLYTYTHFFSFSYTHIIYIKRCSGDTKLYQVFSLFNKDSFSFHFLSSRVSCYEAHIRYEWLSSIHVKYIFSETWGNSTGPVTLNILLYHKPRIFCCFLLLLTKPSQL